MAQSHACRDIAGTSLDSAWTDRYDARMRVTNSPIVLLPILLMPLVFADVPSPTLAADSGLLPIRTPAGIIIQAEIADTAVKRATGLMYREHLDKDHGMLFIFGQPLPWTIWMKNTKIPLDILYFDSERKLVSQQRDDPPFSH